MELLYKLEGQALSWSEQIRIMTEAGLLAIPFVVKGKKKMPLCASWYDSLDEKIHAASSAKCTAIGLVLPDNLCVIDLDMSKDGESEGYKNLKSWCFVNDVDFNWLLNAPTVRTSSGGMHIYLSVRSDQEMRTGSNEICPKVDTRTPNCSLIIIPPSTNSETGKRYAFENKTELPEIPDVLAQATVPPTKPSLDLALFDIDSEDLQTAAVLYKIERMLNAFSKLREGDGRHDKLLHFSPLLGGFAKAGYIDASLVETSTVAAFTQGEQRAGSVENAEKCFRDGFAYGLSADEVHPKEDDLKSYIHSLGGDPF